MCSAAGGFPGGIADPIDPATEIAQDTKMAIAAESAGAERPKSREGGIKLAGKRKGGGEEEKLAAGGGSRYKKVNSSGGVDGGEARYQQIGEIGTGLISMPGSVAVTKGTPGSSDSHLLAVTDMSKKHVLVFEVKIRHVCP